MELFSDYSPVQSSSDQQSRSDDSRNTEIILQNKVLNEGEWYLVNTRLIMCCKQKLGGKTFEYSTNTNTCCCFSFLTWLAQKFMTCCCCKQWKMAFLRVSEDRKEILLTLDQKPKVIIEFSDVIGVHYDRNKDCTNLVLKENKLVSFKGFCSRDLKNLSNAFEYCLKINKTEDKYQHTTCEEVALKEFIKSTTENSKYEIMDSLLQKYELKTAFEVLKAALQKAHETRNDIGSEERVANSEEDNA